MSTAKRKIPHTQWIHAGHRHRIFYEFREGKSIAMICRDEYLSRPMVEQVIREHCK